MAGRYDDSFLGQAATPDAEQPRTATPREPGFSRYWRPETLLMLTLAFACLVAAGNWYQISHPARPIEQKLLLTPLREIQVDVPLLQTEGAPPLTWQDLFNLYEVEAPVQSQTLAARANAHDGRRPLPQDVITSDKVTLILQGYGDANDAGN